MGFETTNDTRICVFVLNEQTFAVEGRYSRQFVQLEQITNIPHAPAALLGVFSVRGQVRNLVDLMMLIGAGETSKSAQTAALFEVKHITFAVVVDSVLGFPVFNPERTRPINDSVNLVFSSFVKGIVPTDSGDAMLLDMEHVMDCLNTTMLQAV